MPSKTEDQIEADKQAVQKMIGAKSAMESALRRIQTLESALRTAKTRIEEIGRGHGDQLAIAVYRDGGQKFVSAKQLTRTAISEIDDAL
jgi:predicted Zn-dependent protease